MSLQNFGWPTSDSISHSHAFLLSSNHSNLGSQDEHFGLQILGTPVSLDLYYFPLIEINRTALQHLLFNAQARFRRQLLVHGDGPLQPDPYQTPSIAGENATMTVKAFRDPGTGEPFKITYQLALDVTVGLFTFLYKDKRRGSIIAYIIDPRVAPVLPSPEKCATVSVRPYGEEPEILL